MSPGYDDRTIFDRDIVPYCTACGALIGDPMQHDTWHALQDSLMSQALQAIHSTPSASPAHGDTDVDPFHFNCKCGFTCAAYTDFMAHLHAAEDDKSAGKEPDQPEREPSTPDASPALEKLREMERKTEDMGLYEREGNCDVADCHNKVRHVIVGGAGDLRLCDYHYEATPDVADAPLADSTLPRMNPQDRYPSTDHVSDANPKRWTYEPAHQWNERATEFWGRIYDGGGFLSKIGDKLAQQIVDLLNQPTDSAGTDGLEQLHKGRMMGIRDLCFKLDHPVSPGTGGTCECDFYGVRAGVSSNTSDAT